MRLAIALGGNPRAITSRYDGTALIAAAHLGHDDVVRALIAAGAPLDHVNNLGWTALMESVVLGDGGPRHVATAKALVAAGASRTIADRGGVTPLQHAERLGYAAMIDALQIPRAVLVARILDFNARIAALAKRPRFTVVDLFSVSVREGPAFAQLFGADGFHPSGLGYERWTDELWPHVEPIGRAWARG